MNTKFSVIAFSLALLLGAGATPAPAQTRDAGRSLVGHWKGTGTVLGTTAPFELDLLPNGQYTSQGEVQGAVIDDAGTWFVTVDNVLSGLSTKFGVASNSTVIWVGPDHIHLSGINTSADLYRTP